MSEVVLTRRAERDLDRLPPSVRERLTRALHRLTSDPLRRAKKLTDPRIGTYRLRVGDWRVIFDVDGDVVVILRVGHRREIYR